MLPAALAAFGLRGREGFQALCGRILAGVFGASFGTEKSRASDALHCFGGRGERLDFAAGVTGGGSMAGDRDTPNRSW